MMLDEMKAKFVGRCVQFLGRMCPTDGALGKVSRVAASGVGGTFPGGQGERFHPETSASYQAAEQN